MLVNIQDLTNAQANEWCARAQEWVLVKQSPYEYRIPEYVWMKDGVAIDYRWRYTPTTNGAQAFDLQEVFKIETNCLSGDSYIATVVAKDGIRLPSLKTFPMRASKLKRAIVNAVIASVYGDSIEIEGEG